MAVLTITVDDAQVARVRAAFGVNTNVELRNAIIAAIKRKVVDHEVEVAKKTAEVDVITAVTAVDTAARDAMTNAEAISVT